MPKADVSEERIVIIECGQRSTDWWNTLLDKLKAHHIPGRYQASVVRAKAAMRGHFKTGHMEWPGT